MRVKVVLFVALFFLPFRAMFGQTTFTIDQMKQMLDASQRRGQLETEGATPFHLVASFETFDEQGRSVGQGKLDEFWKSRSQNRRTLTVPAIKKTPLPDGRTQSTEDFSVPPRTLISVSNGTGGWNAGEWNLFGYVGKALNAVSRPLLLRGTFTDRLTAISPPDPKANLDCIGTEPDIPGVDKDVPLALTTYCVSPGNHLLRLISEPNGPQIGFNDIQSFGNKFIARSIEVGFRGRVRLKLHVDVLEAATDFSSLDVPIPEGATKFAVSQTDSPRLSGELMIGQPLTKGHLPYPQNGLQGTAVIKVHVGTTGLVESAEIISASTQMLKAPCLSMAKQLHYRVSYQGSKAAAVDIGITLLLGNDGATFQ